MKRVNFEDEQLLSVYRDYGVVPKASRDDNFNKPSDDLSLYQLVEPGDLAINKMKAWQGSVAISDFRGIVSPAYFVFKALHNENSRYLHYLLRSAEYTAAYLSISKGIRPNQWDLEPQEHSRMPVLVPPPPEQAAIAAFLDRETGKIDALVEEQKRLIELLKKKRQAVISHAVTKGLNPGFPMKASGIEWLGDVPEHWEAKKLKALTPQITVGIVVEPSKYYADSGVPALRSLNVRPGRINSEGLVYISAEANEALEKSQIRAGDLVAVRSGQPGTTAVVPEEFDGANCIDLIIIRKPTFGSEWFLCWFLASDVAVRQFAEGSGGAIQQHFNIGTAMNLVVAVPPPDEQIEIANFLRDATSKVDLLIEEAERAVELLCERRTAIISAAVTGKIDVRGVSRANTAGAASAKKAAFA
ncbi:restriction endonuclease subunit S domain-containing protein [Mesorhizobium sp. RSR565B]|uniref:restriction endonuclease subunit S n=1 Tax=Mesorhizobium sp. L103C565B0 TaxID=1287094 RepID=UPI0012DF10EE|nr:restriction endonuclease subunit S [Mesorhizobium sp. L103C565B0]